MSQTYTLAQVAEHKAQGDSWIVIHNKVYDVTSYIAEDNHPGGVEVLSESAGTNATESFEDIGHSEDAREQLEPMYIGEIAQEDAAEDLETYKVEFKPVQADTSHVKPKPRSKDKTPSTLKNIAQSTALTSLGICLGISYSNGGLNQARTVVLRGIERTIRYLRDRRQIVPQGHSHSMWTAFGAAFALNLAFVGVGVVYLAEKLDVQASFTSYPATRKRKNHFRTMRSPPIQAKAKQIKPHPCIDPLKWTQFPVSENKQLSHNVHRITFSLPKEDSILGLPIGQHIAIRADINGKSVQRSYTPVTNDSDPGRIVVVFKVYPGGAITNYLAGLKKGDMVDIRGPKGAMTYEKGLTKHIGMIAGGTGITPMYQLIRAICEDKEDPTTVDLLFANNSEEDILLRDELDGWAEQFPSKFTINHVLARPSKEWTGYTGFVTPELIQKHLPKPQGNDSKILLCGPPPMVNIMKETLANQGFERPSAMSKKTDQIFLF
ncbi:cytochrome b5 reductase-like protein, partial [Aureobasidium melanogenum]